MKILEYCNVVPNASPSEISLPLTFLDQIWLYRHPTSRLFFYEFPNKKPEPPSTLITRLKNSLSHTLEHYVPLAGQLTWPNDSEIPLVQYHIGDSVSLTVAETEADFFSLSGNEFRKSDELRCLIPDFPTSETRNPVIALQITLFPDIGFSIGYVAHHGVVDGKSISMFIHTWAYICKNGESVVLPPELTPFFDRSFLSRQLEFKRAHPTNFGKRTDSDSRALATYDMTPPLDILLGTFVLTKENIVALKKSVLAYLENNKKLETCTRVSTFMVTVAYVLVCLVKTKKVSTKKTSIVINVNARARLDPPLPSNYFGNCVVWCIPTENPEEYVLQNGYFVAVEHIMKSLAPLNVGFVKLGEKINEMTNVVALNFSGFIGVGGSPQFEFYKADFGWGRPKKVEVISIDKGSSFYLFDDRDDNCGIEIGVAMKKHEAGMFASIFNSEIHSVIHNQSL